RQIGASLGLSQPAVSRILNRSLAKLRDELESADGAGDTAPEPVIPRERRSSDVPKRSRKAGKGRTPEDRGTRIEAVESQPRKGASDSPSGAPSRRAEDSG